jgi:hypothetical protein
MIVLHPSDLDRSMTAAWPYEPAASSPVATWTLSSTEDAFLDALASDPSFEIDWFLAAVLMSTPAGARETREF